MTLDWNSPDLTADIARIEAETGGVLCLAVRDLAGAREFRYRADRRCRTASVIKLPMLVHLALAVSEGQIAWEEELILTDEEKVGGSGVLTSLTAGLRISIRNCCVLMTIVSDNTATNMLIERIGVAPVNKRMRDLGLPLTTLYRKSYTEDTDESRPYGLGMTTPEEMAALVGMVAEGSRREEAAWSEVRRILAAQTLRDAIPRGLPEQWEYAGKTGGIDGVRNDVALLTAPDGKEIAAALFCQELPDLRWTPDNAGLVALGRVTARLLEGA